MFIKLQYRLNGTMYLANPRPTGLDNVSLITAQEENQCFYRTKWQGELTFHGEDFQRLWDVFYRGGSQIVIIQLYQQGSIPGGSDRLCWSGKVPLTGFTFNIDRRQATMTLAPKPDDGYQTLLEHWHTKVYWLSPANPITSGSSRRRWSLAELLAGMIYLAMHDQPAAALIPIQGIDVISNFLENPINPVAGQQSELADRICYMTDRNIQIDQLSEAKLPLIASLNVLADMLRDSFRLFPYIDLASGKLRWEHESFFPQLGYRISSGR